MTARADPVPVGAGTRPKSNSVPVNLPQQRNVVHILSDDDDDMEVSAAATAFLRSVNVQRTSERAAHSAPAAVEQHQRMPVVATSSAMTSSFSSVSSVSLGAPPTLSTTKTSRAEVTTPTPRSQSPLINLILDNLPARPTTSSTANGGPDAVLQLNAAEKKKRKAQLDASLNVTAELIRKFGTVTDYNMDPAKEEKIEAARRQLEERKRKGIETLQALEAEEERKAEKRREKESKEAEKIRAQFERTQTAGSYDREEVVVLIDRDVGSVCAAAILNEFPHVYTATMEVAGSFMMVRRVPKDVEQLEDMDSYMQRRKSEKPILIQRVAQIRTVSDIWTLAPPFTRQVHQQICTAREKLLVERTLGVRVKGDAFCSILAHRRLNHFAQELQRRVPKALTGKEEPFRIFLFLEGVSSKLSSASSKAQTLAAQSHLESMQGGINSASDSDASRGNGSQRTQQRRRATRKVTKAQREAAYSRVTVEHYREAVIMLQTQFGFHVVETVNEKETAELVLRLCRTVCEAPYKEKDRQYSKGELRSCLHAAEIYHQMLLAIPGVAEDVAKAIRSRIPTLTHLMEAYLADGVPVHDRELLLANITTQAEYNQRERRVGEALSRKIFYYFTSVDADMTFDELRRDLV